MEFVVLLLLPVWAFLLLFLVALGVMGVLVALSAVAMSGVAAFGRFGKRGAPWWLRATLAVTGLAAAGASLLLARQVVLCFAGDPCGSVWGAGGV